MGGSSQAPGADGACGLVTLVGQPPVADIGWSGLVAFAAFESGHGMRGCMSFDLDACRLVFVWPAPIALVTAGCRVVVYRIVLCFFASFWRQSGGQCTVHRFMAE